MIGALRRGPGRICEDDESGSFGCLFREGIVEYEAVHAALASKDVMSADGDLVCLAFANPFDWDEALVGQKFLRRSILLREPTGAFGFGELGCVEVVRVWRGRNGCGRQKVRGAAARVFHDAEVAIRNVSAGAIASRAPRDSHGLLVRLDAP